MGFQIKKPIAITNLTVWSTFCLAYTTVVFYNGGFFFLQACQWKLFFVFFFYQKNIVFIFIPIRRLTNFPLNRWNLSLYNVVGVTYRFLAVSVRVQFTTDRARFIKIISPLIFNTIRAVEMNIPQSTKVLWRLRKRNKRKKWVLIVNSSRLMEIKINFNFFHGLKTTYSRRVSFTQSRTISVAVKTTVVQNYFFFLLTFEYNISFRRHFHYQWMLQINYSYSNWDWSDAFFFVTKYLK